MKIAHIVSTYPPYKGGIGNVCENQVKELRSVFQPKEVKVFTPLYDNMVRNKDAGVIYLQPIIRYGNAAFLPFLWLRLLKYDIIHLHYPFIGAESLLLLKLFSRKKIILQYQMDLLGSGWVKIFFKLHNKFILPIFLRASDKIVVSSYDYISSSVIKKYYRGHSKKFIEIPNGVNVSLFNKKDINQGNDDKKGSEATLLFVGGLDKAHYFKGLTILLEAMERISNAKLNIVGSGNLMKYYKDVVSKKNLHQRVYFFGRINDRELVEMYNKADIFVLPSTDRTEAFGLVLLESLACGTPVIASDLPGVRTVVKDIKDGYLVSPGDSAELAKTIEQALSDRKKLTKMGEGGYQRVRACYSWSSIVRQIFKEYTNLYEAN